MSFLNIQIGKINAIKSTLSPAEECVSCLFVCMFLFSLLLSLSFLDSLLVQHISNMLNLYTCNFFFCTLVLGSTNIFYYPSVKAQCHFFVYLKVDGGQLESFCYFDHHTHFLTCIVIVLSCNHVL